MNRVATALWPSAKGWDAQRWNCASAGGKDFQIPTSKSSKRNPPRYLSALAYADCLRVPDFPLHPNILPVIASDRSNWRDADFRDADSTLLTDWAASGVHTFGVYDYYHGHCFAIPRLFYDEQINSLRWAVSNRAALFYAEVYPDWGFDGAKAWLAARLALDSGQNSALLLRDYFNEAYGPAGEPMRLFHDIVEQCWRENAGSPRWLKFWRSENVGELISPENRQRLRDALARAERAFDEAAAVAAGERYASLDNIGFPFLRTAPNRARNPLQDSERLIRQHVRVRMASLAFGAADAFLEWHQLRASLLRRQPPQTAGDARKAWELLKTEPALRRRMLDAVKRWNNADINPGNPRNPADYFGAGIGATVTERLLAACGAALRRGEDAEWRTFYRDLAREAPALGLAPLVVAAQEPRRLTWLLHERFSHADFAPPPAGSRLAAHPHLTLPAGKWRVNVADCADVEIASHSTETAGENALCVTGASLAEFERDAGGIAPNARVLVKARVCGHISVGGSVTLQIRYLNAKGRELTAHHSAVLLPCAMEDWREFACVGRAPAGAVFAKVALIIRNQDAGEGLAIAGLRVGTL
jgi:uncharacterized membrane protein